MSYRDGYAKGYSVGYTDSTDPTLPPVVQPSTPTGKPLALPDVWTFAAGPWRGLPVTELSTATSRTVTWRLTGNHEASVTINGSQAGYASLGTSLDPSPVPLPVAFPMGYGNMQGPYSTGDSDRMAQLPYQVDLIISMGVDLYAAVELHEDGMDTLLVNMLKAKDADWALGGGGSGNKLLYRPSKFTVSGGTPFSMTGGRDMSDFTVRRLGTSLQTHVLVAHLRADDDDGTQRDKERESQTRFIAQYASGLENVIVAGDFNFQRDTVKKLRGILAAAGLIGLQTRQPGLPNSGKDSYSGGNSGRWIDDIFTRVDQSVTAAAGVKAGKASDHELWMRATIGFAVAYAASATSRGSLGGIQEMLWDLWVIWNGQPLFRGRFGPSSDTGDESGNLSTQLSAADYREALQRRLLFEGDKVDFSTASADESDIAWSLLSSTQAKTGGDLGIVRGLGSVTGIKRSGQKFDLGASVGASIEQLAQTSDGFEWDIRPNLTDTSMTFDVFYPFRGANRDVVLDYGGRVKSFSRQIDPATFGNAVRATGADGVTPTRQEAAGLASDPAGRWDLQFAEDAVKAAAELQGKAAKTLSDAQYIVPSWSVVLTPGTWKGPDDFWLGDVVTLVVQAGRHNVVQPLRVLEMSLSIDENNVDTITVTLGAPPPKLRRAYALISRRLAALERKG